MPPRAGAAAGPDGLVTSNSKVNSMSKKESDKDKHKEKPKSKPQGQGGQDQGKKPKPPKPAKPAADAAAKEAPPEKEKPKPPPRPPADPRMKFIKKFHGKFLPRGPLRDRLKTLMTRWDSGEEHGGVTVEELKSLYEDWKADRAKGAGQRRLQDEGWAAGGVSLFAEGEIVSGVPVLPANRLTAAAIIAAASRERSFGADATACRASS